MKLLDKERTRDINLQIGISDKSGSLKYREYEVGDGLSTFNEKLQSEHLVHKSNTTNKYTDRNVDVHALKDVLKELDIPTINFMKIDVEGFEYEVIKGNDWNKYRPQILCIEANNIMKEWHHLLLKNKYTSFFFDGLNEYFVANEHINLAKNFHYEDTLEKSVISAFVQDDLNAKSEHTQQLADALIRQELVAQTLSEQIHELNAQIARNKRFRSLIKQLLYVTNQIILLKIEKLNKPKVHSVPELLISKNEKDANKIVKDLRLYDFQSYYLLSAHSSLKYSIIKRTYVSIAYIIRAIALTLYKLLRKGLNHAK